MPSLLEKSWPVPRLRDKLRILYRGADRLCLATLPDRLAECYGARPAFFLDEPISLPGFQGDRLDYRDVARQAARAARALRRLGVERGERVGLLTANRIELVFAELGAARLGAVVVPLNPMLRAGELRHLVADAEIRTLVTDRSVFDHGVQSTQTLPDVARWIMITDGEAPAGVHRYADLIASEQDELEAAPTPPDALAAIFYTAGTTGLPKGALLSDGALMFSLRAQARLSAFLPARRDSLSLLVMPLAHTSGHQAMLLKLVMGTPMLLHGRFSPRRVLESIETYKVTLFSGVPAMYGMLLDAGAADYDLSSIEIFAWGGDAMPVEWIERFSELAARRGRFGRRPTPRWVSGYGLAETAGQVTRVLGRPRSPGAIGRPLRGVRVRILDEAGRPVRRGEIGELLVRSPGLLRGYLNQEEATAQALRDGWLRTGDLASRDRRGRLTLHARAKDVIKVGGYSVFPAEVERHLAGHPDVAGVAVVGVPHPVKGEIPVAAVVPRPGSGVAAEELLAWGRGRMAPYKAPREVVFVDEIPVSIAQKARRQAVRERVLALREACRPPHGGAPASAGYPLSRGAASARGSNASWDSS